MGTDIHLKMQRQVGGLWEDMPPQWPKWPFPKDEKGDIIWPDDDPTGRNYSVFAFLAGVRNGSGFAGVPTHEPIEPIAADRGWPEGEPSPEDLYHDWETGEPPDDYWSPGDHSFTWASLKELREANWDLTFDSVGIVRAKTWDEFVEDSEATCPESWCGGVSGRGIVIIDQEDYAKLKQQGALPEGNIQVRGRWSWQPLKQTGFYNWLFGERVDALVAEHGIENLRLLIGFDS